MKKYKLTLSETDISALQRLIEHIISIEPMPPLEDQLLFCGLQEVLAVLKRKQLEWRKQYKITLSPMQAISLRVMFNDYIAPNRDYTNAAYVALLKINNDIHQKYYV